MTKRLKKIHCQHLIQYLLFKDNKEFVLQINFGLKDNRHQCPKILTAAKNAQIEILIKDIPNILTTLDSLPQILSYRIDF